MFGQDYLGDCFSSIVSRQMSDQKEAWKAQQQVAWSDNKIKSSPYLLVVPSGVVYPKPEMLAQCQFTSNIQYSAMQNAATGSGDLDYLEAIRDLDEEFPGVKEFGGRNG